MARTEVTGLQIKDGSVSLTADVVGILPVANGGTGSNTLALNNVLLGNGTGALQAVAPGTTGNVLTSNGTSWVSSPNAGGGGDVTLTGTQTLTNKTLTSPTLNGPLVSSIKDSLGNNSIRIDAVTSGVNYLASRGTAAGSSSAALMADGTDTNVALSLSPKGTGGVNIYSGTGVASVLSATGADTNVPLTVRPKGTSPFVIQTGNTNNMLVLYPGAGGASFNYFNITGAATGATPSFGAVGSDTNVSLNLTSQGTGTVQANSIPVVTTTGTQTLTNKTLTSPAITTPTGIVKGDVGLGNVDNTTDANKPVSTATQTALNAKENTSNKGIANGYASLDSGGKVPVAQLPNSIMEYQGTWNASTNTPTLANGTGSAGDVYRVSVAGTSLSLTFDVGDYIIYNGSTWEKSDTTDAVASVAGRTGNVTLTSTDVGLANVDNTSDATKNAATATLTNKTLTSPRINQILDTSGNVALNFNLRASAVNYVTVDEAATGAVPGLIASGADANISLALRPKGTGNITLTSSDATAVARFSGPSLSTNLWSFTAGAAGTGVSVNATGSDTNISMNLIPKGTGTVQANGVDVVTTTGTQTLTNKTISGASNTITNLPASATPLASRLVATTSVTVANNWTKVATFAPGSNPYYSHTLNLRFVAYGSPSSAVVGIFMGNTTDGTNPSVVVRMTERTGTFAASFLKVVSGVYGTNSEIWITWPGSGTPINVYEIGKYDNFGTVTYHSNGAWQAEPVGAVNNVKTAGVEIATPAITGGAAFTGGMNTFYNTGVANDDWQSSPISILERGMVGLAQSGNEYSPNLNFHWSSRVSNSLWMGTNGALNWGSYTGAGAPSADGTFNATSIYATNFYGALTGNATTATTLQTARTINGVSFNGSANITVADATKEPTITAGTTAQYWRGDKTFQTLDKAAVGLANVDNTSDATKNAATATLSNKTIALGSNTVSGTLAQFNTAVTDADLARTDAAQTFTGVQTMTSPALTTPAITGAITGTYSFGGTPTWPTFNQNTTGSAATLTTARTIGGVSFNGSANIDLPGVNTAGTQNTSGTAAGLSSTLAVGSGGTGATTLAANNVLLGNGTASPLTVAPGTTGNVLTSNGTTWTSAAPTGGVSRVTSTVTSAVTLGSAANTEYVAYIASGGSVTLPTAVGNTSLYTLKNTDTVSKTIATVGDDASFASVTTLLSGNGVDASTVFTDSSNKRTWVGNNAGVKLSTAVKKFGTASISFGAGTANNSSIGSAGFPGMGTSDFTIESWVYTTVLAGANGYYIYDTRPYLTNGVYTTLWVNSAQKLAFTVSAAERITGTTSLAINTWYHVAVSRSGGVTRLFLNGVQEGSNYTDNNNYLTSNPVVGNTGAIVNGVWAGYLDDIRITQGVGRYTANFTAPTAEFPVPQLIDGTYPLTLAPNQAVEIASSGTNWSVVSDAVPLPALTSTSTSATITTLTATSTEIQEFTGTTTHTVRLPSVGIVAGKQYTILNNSTGLLTLQTSTGAQIHVLAAGTESILTALVDTPTTAAQWEDSFLATSFAAGKSLTVNNSLTLAGTDATTMTFPGASDTVVTLAAAQSLTNKTLTTPTLTTPVINGIPTGTGVATAGTVNTLALRDANANLTADNFINVVESTVTAAGTTTLTIASGGTQVFTGTTTQTVLLPTTGVVVGQQYTIVNNSTGAVTVRPSGGVGSVATMLGGGWAAIVIATAATPTTTAHWTSIQVAAGTQGVFPGSGSVLSTTNVTNFSGKTFDFGSNTITGTLAQFNTAVTDADLVSLAGAETLTNKRITHRVNTVTSSATPSINTDTTDLFTITALAVAITGVTATGTPTEGQRLMVRIKDNGTARAITWGASFVSSGVAILPTTTVASKTHHVGFIYDTVVAKWVCIAADSAGY
jgi:hypothetical protein